MHCNFWANIRPVDAPEAGRAVKYCGSKTAPRRGLRITGFSCYVLGCAGMPPRAFYDYLKIVFIMKIIIRTLFVHRLHFEQFAGFSYDGVIALTRNQDVVENVMIVTS